MVSVDANFGLVRKKSSGNSQGEPLHGNYFHPQIEVDEFLEDQPKKLTKSMVGITRIYTFTHFFTLLYISMNEMYVCDVFFQ